MGALDTSFQSPSAFILHSSNPCTNSYQVTVITITGFRELYDVPRGTRGRWSAAPPELSRWHRGTSALPFGTKDYEMFTYPSLPPLSARRLREHQSVLFHHLASHLLGVQLRRRGESLVPWGGQAELNAPCKPASAPLGPLRPSQPSVWRTRASRAES